MRSVNQSTLFNNRFFFDLDHVTKGGNKEDYYTPERKIGAFDNQKKWETCDILVDYHTWSFMLNNPGLPAKKIIRDLINVVDNGGNYLLNVGPDEYGNIRAEDESVLLDIGTWLSANAESIYNTDAGPYLSSTSVSSSHKGNNIYLHALDQAGKELTIPEVPYNTLEIIETLDGKAIAFTHSGKKYHISIKEADKQGITTLKMTFKDKFPKISPKKELIATK